MRVIYAGSLIPGDYIRHPKRPGEWTRVERIYENDNSDLCVWFTGVDDMAIIHDCGLPIKVAEKDRHGVIIDAA